MKTIRMTALLLSCVLLLLPLPACTGGGTNEGTTTENGTESVAQTASETASETESAEEQPNMIVTKTYPIPEITGHLKITGRTSVVSNGLACDHSASGIEFNAYVEGKITLEAVASGDCYFTLYVDGARSETRLNVTASGAVWELADFAVGGVHNFRLVKQTEPKNAVAVLSALSFTGYFEEKPAPAAHFIEFLGASSSTGYGNLISGGTAVVAQTAVNQDATQAYPYLTAEALGADLSLLSVSGIGAVRGYRDFPMVTMFKAHSYYRDQTAAYQPVRTPDLIVVHLGSNDENKNVTVDEWKDGVRNLITEILVNTYGQYIPFIFIQSSGSAYASATQQILNEFGGETSGFYLCNLSFNKLGGNNHPDLASHSAASIDLANFIRDKKIF